MAQEFRKRACQPNNRLSKNAFLAMVGAPPQFGEEFSDNTTRAFFEKLPDEDWTIVSFNPNSRIVCIRVISNTGTRNITVTLPVLSVSKPDFNF